MRTRKPTPSRARIWLAAVLLAASLGVVLTVTMWPTPVDKNYNGTITKLLAQMQQNGLPQWFGYNHLEFSANIAMFVPLGFLVALLLAQRLWWLALIICPLFSVSIEITQALFLSARYATVSDVVSNSMGAVIGILIAVILRAFVYARDQKVIARALWERDIPYA